MAGKPIAVARFGNVRQAGADDIDPKAARQFDRGAFYETRQRAIGGRRVRAHADWIAIKDAACQGKG